MASPSATPVEPRRGFFGALYDMSFRSFVTPLIVQVLYVIALIVVALWSLLWLIAGFIPIGNYFGYPASGVSSFNVIVHVVTAPIAFVLGSVAARIYLELIVATFRIVENTNSLRTRQ